MRMIYKGKAGDMTSKEIAFGWYKIGAVWHFKVCAYHDMDCGWPEKPEDYLFDTTDTEVIEGWRN